MKVPEQKPCHPNLTEAEEESYDIDPSKIEEEKEKCLIGEKTKAPQKDS